VIFGSDEFGSISASLTTVFNGLVSVEESLITAKDQADIDALNRAKSIFLDKVRSLTEELARVAAIEIDLVRALRAIDPEDIIDEIPF
jgi:hypothetical protein